VTSSVVCEISFELAPHELEMAFHVLRDLRAVGLAPGLPLPNDEQALLNFGTTRGFTLTNGTSVEMRQRSAI
jgi:hypothetical protein